MLDLLRTNLISFFVKKICYDKFAPVLSNTFYLKQLLRCLGDEIPQSWVQIPQQGWNKLGFYLFVRDVKVLKMEVCPGWTLILGFKPKLVSNWKILLGLVVRTLAPNLAVAGSNPTTRVDFLSDAIWICLFLMWKFVRNKIQQ